jgi:hypothetical protein
MVLMLQPDPAAAEYDMTVDVAQLGARQRVDLQFMHQDGTRAEPFVVTHERELHLFVVKADLSAFEHLHPAPAGPGRYTLDLPRLPSGEYVILADFVPGDAPPQLLQQRVTIGKGQRRSLPARQPQYAHVQESDGMRISLDTEELRPGTPALLTFTFTDAASGAPVGDLEPYLGAAGHVFVTDGDFQMAAHHHPLEEESKGRVRFLVRFEATAPFRVWLQVQRHGKVITTQWDISVPVD